MSPSAVDRPEQARAMLRARGARVTQQRARVLACVETAAQKN